MQDQEILTAEEARSEEIMLHIRLVDGIARASLSEGEAKSLPTFLAEGYLLSSAWEQGRVVLSKTGRLMADRIVREILV
jgi:oxygen-independent coproporphyrinogen-3 oxidase